MRIEIRRSGGFAALPGLSGPVTLDTSTLPAAEAAAIDAAARTARSSAPAAPPPAARDQVTWSFTIRDGDRVDTFRVDDGADPSLAPLLAFARRALRARGGGSSVP